MNRAPDAPAPERYRVRERRAPTRWIGTLDRTETLRSRSEPPAPRAPPAATSLLPSREQRAFLLLALVLIAGATTGLAIEHNADWYTFDLSWIEGRPAGAPDPAPLGRVQLASGAEDAPGYTRFAILAPTWAWSILISAGAGLLLLEPLRLHTSWKGSARILLLGATATGGVLLTIAAARLMGPPFAFSTQNAGMIQKPTWALYFMLLAGIAATAAAVTFLFPLLRARLDALTAGRGTSQATQAALVIAVIAVAALALSPWIAYGVQADISEESPITAVITDADLARDPAAIDDPMGAANVALNDVRGLLWILLGAAAIPILTASLGPLLPRRATDLLLHAVGLATPLAGLALVQAVRASIKVQEIEGFDTGGNFILLAGAIAAVLACANYAARGAWPALESLRVRAAEPPPA